MNRDEFKYKEIKTKARKKYTEAIRGRDYQDYLYSQDSYDTIQDIDNLVERRKIFQTEICLLEDVFGPTLLQGEE